jgi:prepilin peptidase CpaA
MAVGDGLAISDLHFNGIIANGNAVQTAGVITAIGLLAVVAYSDLRTRRIPNELCLGIAVLGLVRIALAGDALAAAYSLATAMAVFSVAILLFRRGAIGGGDVKLATAMALLLDHHEVFGFLVLMSVCGGVLALAILAGEMVRYRVVRTWRGPPRIARGATLPSRPTVPYGVAIAAAGAITLILAR